MMQTFKAMIKKREARIAAKRNFLAIRHIDDHILRDIGVNRADLHRTVYRY